MPQLPVEFDEADYRTLNPDVAKAITDGWFASGAQHFLMHGYLEDRPVSKSKRRPPLAYPFPSGERINRRDKILTGLDLSNMKGLEIGPLAAPLVKRSEGNIIYVDHASTDEIKKKYENNEGIVASEIVDIDAVWGAHTLRDCTGGEKVDYVIASHVIEHVPDLVTWLHELTEILKENGTIRLAVPDRRYTFDYFMNNSLLSDVLEAHILKRRMPMPRYLLQFAMYARRIDCRKAWEEKLTFDALASFEDITDGIRKATETANSQIYHDVHCWYFSPVSFAEIFRDLVELDLISLSCDFCIETPRNSLEFYVHLSSGKKKEINIASWNAMREMLLRSSTYQKDESDLRKLEIINRICST